MRMGFRFIVFMVSRDNKDVFEEGTTIAQRISLPFRSIPKGRVLL
jgi:hypothetical protein